MADLSTAATILDAVRKRVDDAPAGGHLTDAEKAEQTATHEATNEMIANLRDMITEVLHEHHAFGKSKPQPASTRVPDAVPASSDPNKDFKKATQDNLKTLARTAKNMSGSIANVISNYKAILDLPSLSRFSGTLESVPAVGILDSTIQYVAVTLNADGKTVPTWKKLDTLPARPSTGDTASLFSYRGSFYVAVGRNVWAKTPRPHNDPELFKAAVNDWSQIFYLGWKSIGSVLPAGDSRALIQFAKLSTNGESLTPFLVRIASDGTLSYSSDEVGQNMKFSALHAAQGQTAPNLVKVAYYANSLWGYDVNNGLYELSPNFDLGTYKVKPQGTLSNKIIDLTAVDTGLVAAREDGNLYKLLSIPPKDANSLITQEWRLWVARNGVTSLGAASPGVMLDLKTLSVVLRATYIDTQTNLFPYLDIIQACSKSHGVYLTRLLKAAEEYQGATDEEKKKMAKNKGKEAVDHAKALGKLATDNMTIGSRMVVDMTRQIKSIDSSIAAQLSIIDSKLLELRASLKEAQMKEKELLSQLFAAIATLIIGIGVIIAGFFFPPLAPILWGVGGSAVIGSVVAIGVAMVKLVEIRRAINNLEQAIADLTKQKKHLLDIRAAFSRLTNDYGGLNGFWSKMLSLAGQIRALETLGEVLLTDKSSIIAAQDANKEIISNFDKYVEALGRQGITRPSSLAYNRTHANGQVAHVEDRPREQTALQLPAVLELMGRATQQLTGGDTAGYLSTMKQAVGLHAEIHKPWLAAFLA
ncbi:hypothetical protein QBC43DRAFT_318752 [Cladorrhinum sp. PSN259]|nr:hypothetical protein QBC43DRAFT_318752 [Cladorrhinum sp. PSN259]